MAIMAIFHGVGLTKEKYEALRPLVKWETNHPAGVLLHSAAFDDQGDVHVVDLWESAEQLQDFFVNRLQPAFEQLGIPATTPAIYPAHNINVYPGLNRYTT